MPVARAGLAGLLSHLLINTTASLNDTPFVDDSVIQAHINAGISLRRRQLHCGKIVSWVRTDHSRFGLTERCSLLGPSTLCAPGEQTGLIEQRLQHHHPHYNSQYWEDTAQ